ncbi:MAG: DUF2490 domain-containing protein [Chloroherpetonaceae bacterium]|nr:DUF2490 domain-containing protein [Chloroherpetonaceae bacterium]MCS7210182.1 DUF2490 domain-containing protein [Chloroherpetonaceae bacterium]MDW8019895.1 DUF2490 domain-containing protein [Chloroherpetonaceae bacterium]MDW8467085.1 DUF2490 domain-containing protein [Chloroherpetonaceae bacterium]
MQKQFWVLCFIFCSLHQVARPQTIEHDLVSWSGAMLTVRFGESPWSAQVFVQNRMVQNLSQFQTVVFLLYGLYRFVPSSSVGAGYIFLTPINNRILDIFSFQLWHDFKIGEMPAVLRLRAESLAWHALQDPFFEVIRSWRFRIRPELAIPIAGNFSWLINNEWFFTLEAPVWNQNRFQTGVRYRQPGIVIDVLYQNRIINRMSPQPVRMEHILLLNFFYTLTV